MFFLHQGYEIFALDEIIKNTSEEDIFVSRKSDEKNNTHRHYVDIYIKSLNKCIDVKSLWTYNKKNKGYTYEIWIYDKCGNTIL